MKLCENAGVRGGSYYLCGPCRARGRRPVHWQLEASIRGKPPDETDCTWYECCHRQSVFHCNGLTASLPWQRQALADPPGLHPAGARSPGRCGRQLWATARVHGPCGEQAGGSSAIMEVSVHNSPALVWKLIGGSGVPRHTCHSPSPHVRATKPQSPETSAHQHSNQYTHSLHSCCQASVVPVRNNFQHNTLSRGDCSENEALPTIPEMLHVLNCKNVFCVLLQTCSAQTLPCSHVRPALRQAHLNSISNVKLTNGWSAFSAMPPHHCPGAG